MGKSTPQWIAEAFARYHNDSCRAWLFLRNTRQLGTDRDAIAAGVIVPVLTGADKDMDLASAEHYAFARYLAATTGDVIGTQQMVFGYEDLKFIKFATGTQDDLKVSRFAPVPPSGESLAWGRRGLVDGLVDFRKQNRGNLAAQFLGGRPFSAFFKNYQMISNQILGKR